MTSATPLFGAWARTAGAGSIAAPANRRANCRRFIQSPRWQDRAKLARAAVFNNADRIACAAMPLSGTMGTSRRWHYADIKTWSALDGRADTTPMGLPGPRTRVPARQVFAG